MATAAERKIYADLVRHRELNALRKVMLHNSDAVPSLPHTAQALTQGPSSDNIAKISALEAQMNKSLFARTSQISSDATNTAFANTRIDESNTGLGTSASAFGNQASPQIGLLSEAATLFAQGDFEATKAKLVFGMSAQGGLQDHVPTWLMLLDFYRATHQQSAFDTLALEYAVRFGRSAPAWVAIGLMREQASSLASTIGVVDWVAPDYLDANALLRLQEVLRQRAANAKHATLVIDCRGLVSADPAQWHTLAQTIDTMAALSLECRCYGLPILQTVLQTQANNAQSSHTEKDLQGPQAQQMLAHMALLRLLNRQQPFEDLAVHFSVTFERSPPDWQSPKCQMISLESPLHQQTTGRIVAPVFTGVKPSSTERLDVLEQALLLDGELVGALPAQQAMRMNQTISQTPQSQILSVSCEALMRVDVAAAQSLLAWVRLKQAEGRVVEFKNVHRLISTLFLTLGFYNHARVVIRKD